MARVTSSKGIHLLKQFEGYSDKAYLDSAGIWTIGYGTIMVDGKRVTKGMTCTPEQAELWLREKMSLFENDINRLVKTKLTQNQFDALACFVYNVGSTNFANSTLLKHLNAKVPIVVARFTDWSKVTVIKDGKRVKKSVPGLVRRRKAEYDLFTTLDPAELQQGFGKLLI